MNHTQFWLHINKKLYESVNSNWVWDNSFIELCNGIWRDISKSIKIYSKKYMVTFRKIFSNDREIKLLNLSWFLDCVNITFCWKLVKIGVKNCNELFHFSSRELIEEQKTDVFERNWRAFLGLVSPENFNWNVIGVDLGSFYWKCSNIAINLDATGLILEALMETVFSPVGNSYFISTFSYALLINITLILCIFT